jgi:hypothetical protein
MRSASDTPFSGLDSESAPDTPGYGFKDFIRIRKTPR